MDCSGSHGDRGAVPPITQVELIGKAEKGDTAKQRKETIDANASRNATLESIRGTGDVKKKARGREWQGNAEVRSHASARETL